MRLKTLIPPLFLAMLVLLVVPSVLARDVLQQERCIVEADQNVEGTLFVLCRELRIEGVVEGDVVGFAVETYIPGDVLGSVYLLSGTLNLTGRVTQDVHFGGLSMQVGTEPREDVEITQMDEPSEIIGSIKSAAFNVAVHEPSTIYDGILAFGYQLEINGTARDEINFWGAALQIAGDVDGDIYATVGDPESDSSQIETLLLPLNLDVTVFNPGLFVAEPAEVAGELHYNAPNEGMIAGTIDGVQTFEMIAPISLQTLDEPDASVRYFNESMREFGTLLVIGALTLFALPQWVHPPLRNMRYRVFTSLSAGLLAFIISFPIVLIVLILSITLLLIAQLFGLTNLGIALALVLGVVDIGSVGLFYFVAIYVGRALVGLGLGRFVLYLFLRGNQLARFHDYVALLIGVLLLSLMIALPGIGWIVNAAALFLGLGAILLLLMDQFRRIRDSEVTLAPGWVTPSPVGNLSQALQAQRDNIPVLPTGEPDQPEIPMVPPPPPDFDNPGTQPAPGMRNLPEGFDFDFFNDSSSEPPEEDE